MLLNHLDMDDFRVDSSGAGTTKCSQTAFTIGRAKIRCDKRLQCTQGHMQNQYDTHHNPPRKHNNKEIACRRHASKQGTRT